MTRVHSIQAYYQSTGVASMITNWMFEESTGPVVPLYVPKVYPTETTESTGISLVPLRYNGQDDSFLKSTSENVKAGFPIRALPSYTGTSKTSQEQHCKQGSSLAHLAHYRIEKLNKKNQGSTTEVMMRRSSRPRSLI